jgi:hypothetical protein
VPSNKANYIKDTFTPLNLNVLKSQAFGLIKKSETQIAEATTNNDSLAGGVLGLSLYYYCSSQVFGRQIDFDKTRSLIIELIDRINEMETSVLQISFARGLSGVGYTLNFLSSKGMIEFDMIEEFSGVDEYLFRQAISNIKSDNNDYLHGAFGILHYFLSRKKNKDLEKYIYQIIEEIHKNNSDLDNIYIKNAFIDTMKGKINFSLSHGQVAFFLLLLDSLESGYENKQSIELINNYASFLLSKIQKIDSSLNKLSYFPFNIDKETMEIECTNRLAWCYGDLNQCLLLYRISNFLGDIKYQKIADIVGLSSIIRVSPKDTLCKDSHFCHGASGIAEMYRSLYKLQPIKEYEDAYHYWIGRTIDYMETELMNATYKNKETELLEGLVGPNLTLLSFVSEKPLEWQKFFLLP